MLILDCQSYESTLRSFSNLFNVSPDVIIDILNYIGGQEAMERRCMNSPYPGERIVYSVFKEKLQYIGQFEKTCWFHGTRLDNYNSILQEGLLPLSRMKQKIYQQIKKYPCDLHGNDWSSVINKAEQFFPCRGKDSSDAEGPFAFLIYEPILYYSKFNSGNRDYLRGSELVEDIRDGVGGEIGDNIFDSYLQNTKPAVVKFISKYIGYEIEMALLYLWAKFWDIENWYSCGYNTCFDGNGEIIPPQSIIDIIYL